MLSLSAKIPALHGFLFVITVILPFTTEYFALLNARFLAPTPVATVCLLPAPPSPRIPVIVHDFLFTMYSLVGYSAFAAHHVNKASGQAIGTGAGGASRGSDGESDHGGVDGADHEEDGDGSDRDQENRSNLAGRSFSISTLEGIHCSLRRCLHQVRILSTRCRKDTLPYFRSAL